MARAARLDAPGTLHHVMVRGIEKRRIFENDRDREDFLNRLGKVLEQGQARCFAWALIPNHVHLLLRTGPVPLGKLMRRLLTGYAVTFNLRHQRSGYLFQNRYRSIVCEEDAYLLELVRYIHLNAIRSGLVKDMEELDRYRWSGHSTLMGIQNRPWQGTEEVLLLFGKGEEVARRRYRQFISEGVRFGKRKDLTPEGAGRCGETADGKRSGDSRILGCDSFVEKVLSEMGRLERRSLILKNKQVDVEQVMDFVAREFGVRREEIIGRSRRRDVSKARSVFCHICMMRLGVTGKKLSETLKVSPAGIHLAAMRGEVVVKANEEFQTSLGIYLNNLTPSP
jgi:putative transposase